MHPPACFRLRGHEGGVMATVAEQYWKELLDIRAPIQPPTRRSCSATEARSSQRPRGPEGAELMSTERRGHEALLSHTTSKSSTRPRALRRPGQPHVRAGEAAERRGHARKLGLSQTLSMSSTRQRAVSRKGLPATFYAGVAERRCHEAQLIRATSANSAQEETFEA